MSNTKWTTLDFQPQDGKELKKWLDRNVNKGYKKDTWLANFKIVLCGEYENKTTFDFFELDFKPVENLKEEVNILLKGFWSWQQAEHLQKTLPMKTTSTKFKKV